MALRTDEDKQQLKRLGCAMSFDPPPEVVHELVAYVIDLQQKVRDLEETLENPVVRAK